MYCKHFGLTEKPFSLIPDPDYLYFSPRHRSAFTMLEYGLMEQNGITVITGEVGSGKTTLTRLLLKRINYAELTVGLINNAHGSFDDLLEWVGTAFDIPTEGLSRVALYREIQNFLIEEFSKGKRVVLIVDEAQNVEEKALEELRLLTNINADKNQLVQIVLVGQPELLDVLCKPTLRQLAQRVSSEHHLQALNYKETVGYIRHRLTVAGVERLLFEQAALMVIYYCSGGIPRLINTLCDYALVLTYGADQQKVSLEMAMATIEGKRIGGVDRHRKPHPEMVKVRAAIKRGWGIDIAQLSNTE
ncbi:hypothetical protein A9Q89_04790 [Gammaproteobacteria bacterium 53_120_T64]|nr:hypothetical protein A9Q89_04790 [Gammaproteobacteria bacterium 53_120_T64]